MLLDICHALSCPLTRYVLLLPVMRSPINNLCKPILTWNRNLILSGVQYRSFQGSLSHMSWLFPFIIWVAWFNIQIHGTWFEWNFVDESLGVCARFPCEVSSCGISCFIFTLLASHKSTVLISFLLLLTMASVGSGIRFFPCKRPGRCYF